MKIKNTNTESSNKPITKKITYVEPADYFPKSIRKKYKFGEYAPKRNDSETKN